MWKFDPLPSPSKLAPINAGANASSSSSDNGNMGKYLTTSPPASTAPTSSDPPTPPNLYTDWQRRRSKGSFRVRGNIIHCACDLSPDSAKAKLKLPE